MELEDTIQSSNALYSINIQDTWFGDKDRCAIFGLARVKLRILRKIKTDLTSESINRIGIVVIFPRTFVAFGSFFNHFDCILQIELTSTKPAAEGPNFSFNFPKGVNGLPHLGVTFLDLLFKFELKSEHFK